MGRRGREGGEGRQKRKDRKGRVEESKDRGREKECHADLDPGPHYSESDPARLP